MMVEDFGYVMFVFFRVGFEEVVEWMEYLFE